MRKKVLLLGFLALALGSGLRAQTQPTFSCGSSPNAGYLFQGTTTGVYVSDLSAGTYTSGTAQLIPGATNVLLNAVGYNVKDNYIWAARTATNQLVRIGSDWSVQYFSITGLPTTTSVFYIGDIDTSGIMYLNAGDANIYRVDINPASATYLQMLPTLTTTATAIRDWAFNPVDGNLYAVADNTLQLYRFNRTTGARTLVGTVTGTGLTANAFGASYSDIAGNLYVSDNTTGNVYRINSPQTGQTAATFLSMGPGSSNNDGARCSLGPVINPSVQPPFSCATTLGYLFQDTLCKAYSVDLNSGTTTQVSGQLITGSTNTRINALGYNPKDNNIWGYRQNTNQMVRIGSDWSVKFFPIISLPTDRGIYIGDIDSSGKMYMYAAYVPPGSTQNTTIWVVDLNPASPNYLALTTLTTTFTDMGDWARNPVDNNFYIVSHINAHLYRFSPVTGARTDLGLVAGPAALEPAGVFFGAMYMDDLGNLYINNNGTGKIFKITNTQGGGLTSVLVGTGPSGLSANDGARCPGAVLLPPVPPVAVHDQRTLIMNGTITFNVLTNDTAQTNPIDSIYISQQPNHGLLAVGTNGFITYTPYPNFSGVDSFTYLAVDNQGIVSLNVATVHITVQNDNDNDGIPDLADLDDDNDGIPDLIESGGVDALADADGDGIPNYRDTDYPGFVDTNSDGVNDNFDKDKDGIINQLDLDSDNDGIPDIIEAGGLDTNGDGHVDVFTDTNNNGLTDVYDPANGGTAILNLDSDGDGIKNALDLDSDNDGIPDVVEAGGIDANHDGKPDGTFVDTDNNGFTNSIDPTQGGTPLAITGADSNNDGVPNSYPVTIDHDGDNHPDFIDLDSDNDGIPDIIEAGGTDINGDGLIAGTTDANVNGWIDAYDPTNGGVAILHPDSDGDGIKNTLDLDSDNDGIPDVVEAGGIDANNDGKPDGTFVDADNDGFIDSIDPTQGGTTLAITGADTNNDGIPNSYPAAINFDGDSVPNFWDLDSDNDGITDVKEAGLTDTNNDGKADGADANNDGWSDTVDALTSLNLPNTDGAGKPNYLDIDADDDGIVDNIEGQSTVAYIVPLFVDVNNNGLDDAYETGGLLGILPVDTDGDGIPDYLDGDTDDDGLTDMIEGWDINGNGVIDGAEKSGGVVDADGDGLLDGWDNNPALLNVTNGTTPSSYPGSTPTSERNWRVSSVPLPVTLVQFTGTARGCNVALFWETGIESNVALYEVQHSMDGIQYNAVGTVKATGSNSQYNYIYNVGENNKHYFRLKTVDRDAQSKISNVVPVSVSCNEHTPFIYPNPTQGEVTITGLKDKSKVRLINNLGQLVKEVISSGNTLIIDMKEFAPGIYLVQIEVEGMPSTSVKVDFQP